MAVTVSAATSFPVQPAASSTALMPTAKVGSGTSSVVPTASSHELTETNPIVMITNLFAQIQEAPSADSKHEHAVSMVISANQLQLVALPTDYTMLGIFNFYQKDLAPLVTTSFRQVAGYLSIGDALVHDQCVCKWTEIDLNNQLNALRNTIAVFKRFRDTSLTELVDSNLESHINTVVGNVNTLCQQANHMHTILMRALTEGAFDKLLKRQLSSSLSFFDIPQIENK